MAQRNPERDVVEELASEFIERLRNGESPAVDGYAERYPERAEEIRALFPTIALMECSKAQRKRSSDGRVSLGAARPERLGDYRILGEIGRGGMGVVYEAEQESLGRRVALKVLPRQALHDPKQLERFQREARTVARLHHTNIVPVFGVGHHEGLHYYVMQLIPGAGLDAVIAHLAARRSGEPVQNDGEEAAVARALLAEGSPGYWRQVVRIGVQAAEALHHAHTQGILHRDVKPANLLLDRAGKVWVTDFGLARALENAEPGASDDLVGTLRYVAPEAFQNHRDHRSDVYGLGLTLYEMLALRPAFREADRYQLIQQITAGDLTSLRSGERDVPRDVETVVLKAAALEPEQRYESAGALAEDLRRLLDGRPIRARRFTSAERLWHWCRRHPAVAGLATTVAILLLVVAAVSLTAYVRTRRALDGESEQRARSEATAELALEALDRTFIQFAPPRAGIPAHMTLEGAGGEVIEMPAQSVLTKETAAFLEEMLSYYDRLAQQAGTNATLRRATARANLRVGDIQQRLGRSEPALAAYERAAALYRQFDADSGDDAPSQIELAVVHNQMGVIFRERRRPDEARLAHRAALALLEPSAAGEEASAELLFELARTYYLLGRWTRPDPAAPPPRPPPPFAPPPGHVPESPDVRRAVALLTSLQRRFPSVPAYRHLLACCYRDLAHGVTDPAKDQAIAILEQLVAEYPGVPEYLYDLSETYAAFDVRGAGLPPELAPVAERQLVKALEVAERLRAAYPHVPDYGTSLVHIRHKLGAVLRRLDRPAEAEMHLRKAIDLQAALAREFAGPASRMWLAIIRHSLADLLITKGDLAEARSLLEQSVTELKAIPRDESDRRALDGLLGDSYARLRRVLGRMGDITREAEARREAESYRPHLPGPRP